MPNVSCLLRDVRVTDVKRWWFTWKSFVVDKTVPDSKLIRQYQSEKWAMWSLTSGLQLLPETIGSYLNNNPSVDVQLGARCSRIEFMPSGKAKVNRDLVQIFKHKEVQRQPGKFELYICIFWNCTYTYVKLAHMHILKLYMCICQTCHLHVLKLYLRISLTCTYAYFETAHTHMSNLHIYIFWNYTCAYVKLVHSHILKLYLQICQTCTSAYFETVHLAYTYVKFVHIHNLKLYICLFLIFYIILQLHKLCIFQTSSYAHLKYMCMFWSCMNICIFWICT